MKPTNESPASPSDSTTSTPTAAPGSMQALLQEYGESHQHPINKRIHYLCVPAIFWSILALLWAVKLPAPVSNLAWPALVLVLAYYLIKSPRLAIPLAFFMGVSLLAAVAIERAGWPLWPIALGIFVVAWIGQFIGHAIEGRKPSFFKDLQFLLVGPAWIARQWLKKPEV